MAAWDDSWYLQNLLAPHLCSSQRGAQRISHLFSPVHRAVEGQQLLLHCINLLALRQRRHPPTSAHSGVDDGWPSMQPLCACKGAAHLLHQLPTDALPLLHQGVVLRALPCRHAEPGQLVKRQRAGCSLGRKHVRVDGRQLRAGVHACVRVMLRQAGVVGRSKARAANTQ